MFGIPLAATFPISEVARAALSILHHHHESPRTTGRRPVRSLTAAAPVIQNIFLHLRRVAVRCSTPITRRFYSATTPTGSKTK
jgi:hypothetical protein